ncbi:MAG: L,D-transpeptidase family protein [Bauldia sp.]|nr:L,D-transpeptidase family protein [Bauldia sp.]
MRRIVGIIVGGSLLAGIPTASLAYFAEDTAFTARNAGAASLVRQSELGTVETAIRSALAALEGANANLQYDIDGIRAFYAERGFAPAWIVRGRLSADARAIIARLGEAADDGLDPAAYAPPDPDFGMTASLSADMIAAAEIEMSVAVAAYVREAYAGRLDPRALDPNLDMDRHLPNIAAALADIGAADDGVAALAAYNPQHPGYVALRAALAEARGAPAIARVVIPAGPTLRPGDTDERVGLLRTRLDVATVTTEPSVYDETLVQAVRAFQTRAGLIVDGIIGPNTIGALNGPAVDPVGEIIANMERYRWLPRDLGSYYVQVNIPEYLVRIFDRGEEVWETRVVVGQPANETPVFSDRMEYFVVNPYWNVPPSIVANELLPQLRADPGYFVRGAFDVFYRGNLVDPYSVNWYAVTAGQVSIRQRPGPSNALGQIKFMFPNSHNVYLHDTPSKSLFQRDARAFSHGCVRVMNPMDFAEALLRYEESVSRQSLEAMFGPTERQVNLNHPINVHLTYFTAVFDDAGNLQFKPDIYGHSARVREALGLGDGAAVVAAASGAAGDVGP